MSSSLESMPLELLLFIFEGLLEMKDVLSLALASRTLNHVASKHIYESFHYCDHKSSPYKAFENFSQALQNRRVLAKYVRRIALDERAYMPCPLVASEATSGMLETRKFQAYATRVLMLCSAIEEIHLTPIACHGLAIKDDPSHPLNPLIHATLPRPHFHRFPKLKSLSLDMSALRHVDVITFTDLLRILSIPSLQIISLKDLLFLGLSHTVPKRELAFDHKSHVSTLYIEGDAFVFHVDSLLNPLLGSLPKLRTLKIYLPGSFKLHSNPTEMISLTSFISALQQYSVPLEELDLCAPQTLLGNILGGIQDQSPPCRFENLRRLIMPESVIDRSAIREWPIGLLSRRLKQALPSTLQYLGFYADIDTSVIVQFKEITNAYNAQFSHLFTWLDRCGENPTWRMVREVVENPNSTLSHQILALERRPLVEHSRIHGLYHWHRAMKKIDFSMKFRWTLIWDQAAAVSLFENLERVEYLHYGTRAYTFRSRDRKEQPMFNGGAEKSIVIWQRRST